MKLLTLLYASAVAHAQDLGGFSEVSGGGTVTDPRDAVLNILINVLDFVGLIVTVVIVIAGIMLVVSGGEEGQKDRAKKIIIYAIVGLVVIVLARTLVVFLIDAVSGGAPTPTPTPVLTY